MKNRKVEDLVFNTTASCAMLVVGAAIAALLYALLTVAVPLLESIAFPQMM